MLIRVAVGLISESTVENLIFCFFRSVSKLIHGLTRPRAVAQLENTLAAFQTSKNNLADDNYMGKPGIADIEQWAVQSSSLEHNIEELVRRAVTPRRLPPSESSTRLLATNERHHPTRKKTGAKQKREKSPSTSGAPPPDKRFNYKSPHVLTIPTSTWCERDALNPRTQADTRTRASLATPLVRKKRQQIRVAEKQ
ncbi:MAG: hypothetical protein M2R45_00534 [Verrucomicrobia subdivision 3 bacterium]|nr:hypothetical protein [Limisphaerales bacterium]MCS1413588.1 hypothetical protein [Limisphaerales bacterium]